MRSRASVLIAFVLLLHLGGSTARADWEVRRSAESETNRLARVFRAEPDAALAARLVRGQSQAGLERLLRQFGQTADDRPDDYGAQLAHAQLLLVARRWSEASARFERAATLSPAALAPRWGRARALREAGKLGESVTELRAALGAARAPQEVERVARELTATAVAAGDVEAEIDGRRARLGVRVDGGAVLALAAALNQIGRPGEAAAVLQQHDADVARTAGARARWALAEGQYRAAAGDTDGAAVALARAAAEVPLAQTELRREIWQLSVEVARRRGALDDLKRRLSAPVDVIEWVARGRVADEQGDLRGAAAAVAEAVRRAPRDLELRLREIALARRVGSAAEISALYEQLILVATAPRAPAPAVAVDALDGLWQLGRPEVAGRMFDTVLARRAQGAEMLRALGEAASRWGDDRRAERCWTALLRRRPGDEVALVALGELQLQRGQRRSAIDTWRAVLRGPGVGRASRQARFAEILADHELHQPALTEARAAAALSPTEPRYQRLIATILERQSRFAEAENAWETVLRLAQGGDRASERAEARTRLVNLWLRGGSARLEGKLRATEQALADGGGDREMLLFLVQAQLRTGRGDAAIALLKAALARVPPGGVGGSVKGDDPADAELMLLLVRTLRQAHRTDEAMSWLEELSRRFPARAREAQLQLADMAVVAHADDRAQAYAEQAATTAAGDPRVLLRAAGVQERLGHQEEAAGMYRRLLQAGRREPSAALALAALLARTGEVQLEEQRSLLREVLHGGTEEDVVALAGARAIVLEEASGRLDALEAFVADTPDLNASAPAAAARRRVLAAILWRLVPPLYRELRRDPRAAAKLDRLARHGVRPLVELVSAPDTTSDVRAIELLGMLGRPEAVPGLARLLVPDVRPAPPGAPGHAPPAVRIKDDLAATIVIALGRLGGESARVTLEAFAAQGGPTVKLPLLWALGRVGGAVATGRARQEVAGNGTDGAIIGCLSLGRIGGADAEGLLVAVAGDFMRPVAVRVAALLGLGLGGRHGARPLLRQLADTADRDLAAAAGTSLALLDGARQGQREDAKQVPDEAAAIVGTLIDPQALLHALQPQDRPLGSWSAESETAAPAGRTTQPDVRPAP